MGWRTPDDERAGETARDGEQAVVGWAESDNTYSRIIEFRRAASIIITFEETT